MPELDSEAIDFGAASESFAVLRRLRQRDMESLRLETRHQRRKVPIVGGMLLFGRERERYFPDAGFRSDALRAPAGPESPTKEKYALTQWTPFSRPSPSRRNTRSSEPKSAHCGAAITGVCLLSPSAKRSSTPSSTQTTRGTAHPSAYRFSTTVSRWKAQGSCPLASPSRISGTESRSRLCRSDPGENKMVGYRESVRCYRCGDRRRKKDLGYASS